MIKAFEPDPGIYSILQQNIDTAKFENIHLFNKAVWTKDSVLNFHSEGSDAGSISDNGGPNLKVKAIQLSKFLAECPQNIDLLKIDIEGAEYEVLLSCKDQLSKVDNIFVECHTFPNQPQRIHEVLKMFEDLNFRYYIQNVCTEYLINQAWDSHSASKRYAFVVFLVKIGQIAAEFVHCSCPFTKLLQSFYK